MEYLTLNPVRVGDRSLTDSLKDMFPNSDIAMVFKFNINAKYYAGHSNYEINPKTG